MMSEKDRLPVSIGVFVYNEEKNIARLLCSLLAQKNNAIDIREIIVISSGSTDRTDAIISDYLKKHNGIKLIVQQERKGKASAVNLFFENASQDILVLVNGDTVLREDSIEKLVMPFHDSRVGMTGGHPVPVNDKSKFLGFTAHLLWNMHHLISLNNPKLGELIALRKIIRIPCDTAVDEAWMEAMVKSRGFELRYVPDAMVYNKGPESVSDFLKQRRRIFTGHLDIKKKTGYKLSTLNSLNIMLLTLRGLKLNPKVMLYTSGAVLLEFLGRALGFYDYYIRGRNPFVWEVIKTTKELKNESNACSTLDEGKKRVLWDSFAARHSLHGSGPGKERTQG